MNKSDIKNKVDIVGKKIDIFKSKLIAFIAIGGGSWVYLTKLSFLTEHNIMIYSISLVLMVTFVLCGFGVITNLEKLTKEYKTLERLENV